MQFDPEFVVHIESAGYRDPGLSKVGRDAPVTNLGGMGEGVAGDASPEAHVVQLGGLGP